MIRVLVVEDSPTARALIVEVLAGDPSIAVVGEARTGAEAVAMTSALRPDLVTMDIEMPGLDGLAASREIMERTPTPIVIVSSSTNRREADRSLEAIAAGALAVIDKPGHVLDARFDDWRRELLALVSAMAHVRVVRRQPRLTRRTPGATPVSVEAVRTTASRTRLVAIAASTGGPTALLEVLRRLPADFPVPIVVVQHIAQGFAGALADWLNDGCRLRVKLAAPRDLLRGGTVFVAPDDHQLGVADGAVVLSAPVGGAFCPSATHLFESAARSYGTSLLAMILTGMGMDGVAGLRVVHAMGGRVYAQDEASCVVYGMPREAVRAGVVHAVLSPHAMADQLLLLTRRDKGAD